MLRFKRDSRFWSCFGSLSLLVLAGCVPGYKRELIALKRSLIADIGAPTLRAWAVQEIQANESRLTKTNKIEIEKSEVLDSLRTLKTPYPFGGGVILRDPSGQTFVSVVWASGRGVLGINIGATNYQRGEPGDRYWLPLERGIFLWSVTN